MITLGLDCSQPKMLVALLQAEQVIASHSLETQNTSDSILQAVQSLLQETGLALTAITHIIYGHGPGSFTSLRIGLATLWGLFGFTPSKPKIAMVSSLELRLLSLEVAENKIIIFPARLKKVYAGWVREQNFTEACLNEEQLQRLLDLGLTPVKNDPLCPKSFENIYEKSIAYKEFLMENVMLNYLQPQSDVAMPPNKT